MTGPAEEARRLLDNGYQVLLFKDGLGQYSALAVPEDASVDAALDAWAEYESAGTTLEEIAASVFEGPNRYCGCGHSVGAALHAAAEKVFLRRLPDRPPRPSPPEGETPDAPD